MLKGKYQKFLGDYLEKNKEDYNAVKEAVLIEKLIPFSEIEEIEQVREHNGFKDKLAEIVIWTDLHIYSIVYPFDQYTLIDGNHDEKYDKYVLIGKKNEQKVYEKSNYEKANETKDKMTINKSKSSFVNPTWLNPSNSVWLNIVLYGFIVFEILMIIVASYALGANEIFGMKEYLLFLILIVVFHMGLMLSLNMVFNIQNIKNDIASIKDKLVD